MIGPSIAADAADHGDEDDEGGPVVDRKRGVGGDADFLQEYQRADHRGAEGDGDIDGIFDAHDVDAVRSRAKLVVADRGEREPVARAQQPHDSEQDADHLGERDPVDEEFAHLPARRDRDDDRSRQAGARAAAKRRCLRREQPEHLGHHPGADGEIVSAQPEHQRRDRHGNDRRRRRPRSGWRRADARPRASPARTADRRRARRRPAARPRRGRHSPPADSTGSPARHRRRFRRAAAGPRARPTTAPRRARRTRGRRSSCRSGSTSWRAGRGCRS